jgi:hypothetical protein
LEGQNIRINDEIVVDIMLNANGQTYESLLPYQIIIDWEGVPVRCLNLEGLLLTKKTMRDKDIADRLLIERTLAELSKNNH